MIEYDCTQLTAKVCIFIDNALSDLTIQNEMGLNCNMKTFDEIVKEYYKGIYNYAYKLACNPDLAQDLTQQTFLNAFENYEKLENEQAVSKWLRTICYRNFLTFLRDSGVKEETPTEMEELEKEGAVLVNDYPLPEEEVVVADEVKTIQNGCFVAMVRKLSLKQRIAFSLVDMFGMNQADAAELLELSPNALKALLYRARMNLDSFFDGHCNLIDAQNPCSCKAWINFRTSHENNKTKMKEAIDLLDYKQKGYRFNPEIRSKISYLYSNIPEQKPEEGWFEQVINSFK